MKRSVLLFSTCGSLLCSPAVAQSNGEPGQTAEAMISAAEAEASFESKEEIVVTAARVPTPVTAIPNTVRVLDRDTIETQTALSSSLLDSLSFSVPSLAPGRQKMTSFGESLRGRTPLYLVDGIPQSTPLRDGKRSGFTIDPAFVDRVEVIFGANAIQGVGATGGIINYVTPSAPKSGEWLNRFSVELTTDDFEDDALHYRTSALIGRKFGAIDLVTGVSFEKRGLFYDGYDRAITVDPIQGDIMDTRAWSLFAKLGWDVTGDQRLEFTSNIFDQRGQGDYVVVPGSIANGVPASSREGDAAGDPTRNEARNFALTYRNSAVLGGELAVQGFYYDFYGLYGGGTFPAFQDIRIAPAGTLFDQSALTSRKRGGKLTYSREDMFWQGLQLITGLDYLRDRTFQDLAQTGRLWVPNLIYRGWAPFVQLEQKLVQDKLRLSGGLRYENATLEVPDFTTIASANSTSVEGASPRFKKLLKNAGLVFEPWSGISAFASYAQGFTMPDAGLILRAVNRPDQSVSDLVDLKPVIADNVEIGTTIRRGGLNASASYFQSNSDLGSRIQVINGVGVVQRERTEIKGLELALSYLLPQQIRFGLAYSQLIGRYDINNDGKVDRDLDGRNIAPDRLNLFVDGPITSKLRSRVQVSRLLDRTFKGNAPGFNFNGHTLVDALLAYKLERRGTVTLGIQNLLDKKYISYFSQTYSFRSNNDYTSGRGRAVTLRWQGRF